MIGKSPKLDFELEEATIGRLQELMRSGELTAIGVTEMYLDRIASLDRTGPELKAVLEINPDVLEIAQALDAERQAHGPRGALHGMPVLIKDNIDTADQMATAAGSLALVGSTARSDAFVARRLRDAGAILLGKTNMSEWANFRSTHSTSGWSARGGLCRNPYAPDRTANGSSTGSGVAAAANYAAVTIGTETDGSIVLPAAANGVVGLKPTVGLTSRTGVIPISHSQDTIGPLARTVRDAAIVLGVIAAPDPEDPGSRPDPRGGPVDYTRFLDPDGLRRARIGVPRRVYFGRNREADDIIENALEVMRLLGAQIVDPADIPTAVELRLNAPGAERAVCLHEFKAGLNSYLARRDHSAVRTLADLIAFNEDHVSAEMPWFGQELLTMAQETGPLTELEYIRARAECRQMSRDDGIDAVMDAFRLDALVMPTCVPPWKVDLAAGDPDENVAPGPAAQAGYPLISVPAGFRDGVPYGLLFVGRAFSEPTLVRLAYAFEQASLARRPPRFGVEGDRR